MAVFEVVNSVFSPRRRVLSRSSLPRSLLFWFSLVWFSFVLFFSCHVLLWSCFLWSRSFSRPVHSCPFSHLLFFFCPFSLSCSLLPRSLSSCSFCTVLSRPVLSCPFSLLLFSLVLFSLALSLSSCSFYPVLPRFTLLSCSLLSCPLMGLLLSRHQLSRSFIPCSLLSCSLLSRSFPLAFCPDIFFLFNSCSSFFPSVLSSLVLSSSGREEKTSNLRAEQTTAELSYFLVESTTPSWTRGSEDA